MNNIKLFYISKRNFKKAKNLLKKTRGKWVFAGSSYITHAAASNILGPADELRLSAIEPTAIGLLDDYINYIGELSLKYNSRSWWESIISEKNPFLSSILQNLCLYFQVKKITDTQDNLIILVDNVGLYRLLADELPGSAQNLKFFVTKIAFYAGAVAQTIINRLYFILSRSIKIIQARWRLRAYYIRVWGRLTSSPLTIKHAWVDARSFSEKGAWRDSYFGELDQYLEKQDVNYVIFPHILLRKNFKEYLSDLQKEGNPLFMEPHYFLKFRHIFRFAFFSIKRPRFDRAPLFKGVDLKWLLWAENWNDRLHNRIAYNRSYLELPLIWAKAGIKIDRAIYTFENQAWEKTFLIGLRDAFPMVKTVSYQHSSFSKLLTNYYISDAERGISPRPDVILTTGPAFRDILEKNFGPQVKTAGAFRYNYLFAERSDQAAPAIKGEGKIVIATSIDLNDTLELLAKTAEALGKIDKPVIVKTHPVLQRKKLARLISEDALPKNFKFTSLPIAELLTDAALVIYSSTTVCLEALAASVPVIRAAADFRFTYDPLADYSDLIFTARSPAELRQAVLTIMADRDKIIAEHWDSWQKLIDSFFTKPTDDSYAGFLS